MKRSPRRSVSRPAKPARVRLSVEPLEDRATPATIVVSTTEDSLTPMAGISLRQAVASVNLGANLPGVTSTGTYGVDDTILFDSDLNGETILLNSGTLPAGPLPAILNPLTITGLGSGELAISGTNSVRVFDVAATAGTVTITGLTLTNGRATFDSPPLDDGNGAGIRNAATLALADVRINDGFAFGFGGGIFSTGSLTLTECFLTDNRGFDGGGIYSTGQLAVIDSGIATNSTGEDGFGGGVFTSGVATFDGSDFSANIASEGTGGGAFNSGTLTVTNTRFAFNVAGSGGGVFNGQIDDGLFDGVLIVTGGSFVENVADVGEGGGIWNRNGQVTIDGTLFDFNQAADDAGGFGGAISNQGFASTLRVSAATFRNNKAGVEGGAISVGGELSVIGSTFEGNAAGLGGGGAIRAISDATVVASTFTGNQTDGDGGGVSLGDDFGNTYRVVNSTFDGNTAAGFGGGIAIFKSIMGGGTQNALISGTTVVRNTAATAGGIYNDLFLDFSEGGFGLANTVVALNTATSGTSPDIVGPWGRPGNVIGDPTGSAFTFGSNPLTGVDPLLGPLAANGGPTKTAAPQAGSPVLGFGSATALTDLPPSDPARVFQFVDQRGFSRPAAGPIDSGAFQAQRPFATPNSFSTSFNQQLNVPAPGVLAGDLITDPAYSFNDLTAVNFTQPAAGTGTVVGNPDGSFTYTPPAEFTGTTSFTYQAFDEVTLSPPTSVFITVTPAGTITLSPPTLPDGTVGTRYAQTILATGGTPPYSFSVSGSLPPGLTLNPLGGSLTGVPTTAGSFTFTVIVNDSTGSTGSRTYTLAIDPAAGITLSPAVLPRGTAGQPYSQQVTATGGTGPYTFTLTGERLPPRLFLSPSGLIFGTPTAPGSTAVTITATDSLGVSGSRDYTIVVDPAPPGALTILPAALPAGTVGSEYSQTLTVTGGNGPFTFRIISGSLPPGLTLDSSGVISGTPPAAGTASFAVLAEDFSTGAVGSRDYTLVVNPAPVTIALSPSVLPGGQVGTAYSQAITATGGSGPVTFAVSSGALPAGLTLSSGGVISGTPTAVGQASFTVTATDAQGNAGSQAYVIAVNAVPVVPTGLFAVGVGAGPRDGIPLPQVRVFNDDGSTRFDLNPFEASFTGGVRVAVGDVNGDGVPDIICGAGIGGAPRIVVFDGATGRMLTSFFAYDDEDQFGNSNRLGVFVAVGDVTGDGIADIVAGIGSGGGARVRVFDGRTFGVVKDFFAYDPTFRGGVRVAVGDVTGDGLADIVTAPGPSGGPDVRVFDATMLPDAGVATPLRSFNGGMAADYRGGAFVAVIATQVEGVSEAEGFSLIVVSPDSFPDFEGTELATDFGTLPDADGAVPGGQATPSDVSAPPMVFITAFNAATQSFVPLPPPFNAFPVLMPSATTGVRVAGGLLAGVPGLFVGSGPQTNGFGPTEGGRLQFYAPTENGMIATGPAVDVAAFGFSIPQSLYVAGSLPPVVQPPSVSPRPPRGP